MELPPPMSLPYEIMATGALVPGVHPDAIRDDMYQSGATVPRPADS
jgi:hypothetical protein